MERNSCRWPQPRHGRVEASCCGSSGCSGRHLLQDQLSFRRSRGQHRLTRLSCTFDLRPLSSNLTDQLHNLVALAKKRVATVGGFHLAVKDGEIRLQMADGNPCLRQRAW